MDAKIDRLFQLSTMKELKKDKEKLKKLSFLIQHLFRLEMILIHYTVLIQCKQVVEVIRDTIIHLCCHHLGLVKL